MAKATDPAKVAFWQEKADFYRQALAGRCVVCGRELSDPESVARRVGPECLSKMAEAS